MANSEKILTFTAAVRGFHYYQKFWMPEENEKLDCSHERGNFYDRFAIKTTSGNGTTVNHLPKESSPVPIYLIEVQLYLGAIIYQLQAFTLGPRRIRNCVHCDCKDASYC